MSQFALIVPEILLAVGALLVLFSDLLPRGDRSSAWVGFALAATTAAVAAFQPAVAVAFGGVLEFTPMTRFARVAIALLLAVWCMWVAGRGAGPDRRREAIALAMFSASGTMLVTSAAELVTLFMAIELATIPGYVLLGYNSRSERGLEGALKYFLLSILTTMIMLYGLSFLYGMTGTTLIAKMDLSAAGVAGLIAGVLAIIGLLSKVSAAPFHYWAPDAYEGAGAWAVAYASTVPKIGGAVVLVRIALMLGASMPQIGLVLAIVSVVSVLLGNLAALTQTDIRRMMAYSGVGHAGYLLLGVAALTAAGAIGAVFYAVAYAVASLAFMLLVAENGTQVDDWNQLATRRPVSAWAAVLFLLSLIGIPPLIGFFGKLYLFTSALQVGLSVAVVVAVVASVVSAGYYLRIVRAAFFGPEPSGAPALERSNAAAVAVGVLAFATIMMGLFAGPIFAWMGAQLP